MRVPTAFGVALAGGMFLAWPSSAQPQGAAGGETVPAVHFDAGSAELLPMAYPDYARDAGALEDDIEWTREHAEPLIEWWESQGMLFLQRVADFAGLDWPYRDIEVYLVRRWPVVSIEYPLVLALGSIRGGGGEVPVPEEEDVQVLLLAHQLTHYLLDDPEFVPAGQRHAAYGHPFMAPGDFDVEAMVNWLTYRTLEDLWGRARLDAATENELWRAYNPNHEYVVEELDRHHRLSRLNTLAGWLARNREGSEIFRIRETYAARVGTEEGPTPETRERTTGTDYGLDLGATYDGKVFVAYVDEASPASRAGVLQGDVLRTIEGRPVVSDVVDAQRRMTESWERDGEINLSVERSGEEIYLTVERR